MPATPMMASSFCPELTFDTVLDDIAACVLADVRESDDLMLLDNDYIEELRPLRNHYELHVNIRTGEENIDRINHNGSVYRTGSRRAAELHDGTIVGIDGIISVLAEGAREPQIYITGPLYKRTRYCGGMLGCKLNEVAMVDDSVMVPLEDAWKPRIVIRTNAPYPKYNTARTGDEDQHPLVCRWKVCGGKHRGAVTRLQVHEIPQPKYRWANSALRKHHRGDQTIRYFTGKYTFGDGFCGAGGASRGAEDAGLQVRWGFDKDDKALEAYQGNFPQAKSHRLDVTDFLSHEDDLYVDVLHVSPPCQPHSQAHTIAGKDDDDNEAAGLAFGNLINKVKPRVVTLEQTDGIMNMRRRLWFNTYVAWFTYLGYSVQWEVLYANEFGVPQSRKRLIMLASGPGEPLMSFPAPTHQRYGSESPNTNLSPPATVAQAISDLPLGVTCHEISQCLLPAMQLSKVEWNGQVPTVKTNGLDPPFDVHPDGYRRFTPRELACFQTFPFYHTFAGGKTHTKRQIGNAVPPLLAKAIFKEVCRILEQADLITEIPEIIVIDDEDVDSDEDVVELSLSCLHDSN